MYIISSAICSLPPDAGPCRASFTKVYYNPRTRQCEGFLYGGCMGNENNFNSVQECLQRCGGATGGGVTGGGGKYIPYPLFLAPYFVNIPKRKSPYLSDLCIDIINNQEFKF